MNLNEAVAGAVASSLYPEMRFSWEIKVNIEYSPIQIQYLINHFIAQKVILFEIDNEYLLKTVFKY